MFLRVRVGGPSFLKLADVCPLDGAGKFKSTHSIVNRHSIDEYSRYTIKVEVGRTQEISEGNVARALLKEFQSSRT